MFELQVPVFSRGNIDSFHRQVKRTLGQTSIHMPIMATSPLCYEGTSIAAWLRLQHQSPQ